jgi:hypothetical protein
MPCLDSPRNIAFVTRRAVQLALDGKPHPGGPLLYHALIVRLSPLAPDEPSARRAWWATDGPSSTAQNETCGRSKQSRNCCQSSRARVDEAPARGDERRAA